MALQRKVIAWRYSRLITLPKSWTELQGLNKGDVVFVDMDKNGNLVVYGKSKT